jgi:short-subunit dehydrogenase
MRGSIHAARPAHRRITEMEHAMPQSFAIVTGASSGIGLELARCCAREGFDLLIAADEGTVDDVAEELREIFKVDVKAVEVDLSTTEGVDQLCAAAQDRPVDALLANAGHGLGKAFLDQDFREARHVVDTNITGTIYLIHKIGNQMRTRGTGRILIIGSIAGFEPGAFQAVYNGTKAFVDSFAAAIRNELKETGVTVTCLMPGPTDTAFFERADLTDTDVGQDDKDNPADVAKAGFDAMMKGDDAIIYGWKNKLQVAASRLMPSSRLAEQHRKIAEPGSGDKTH